MKPTLDSEPSNPTPVPRAARSTAAIAGRISHGERTRREILAIAVNVASVEGLEGLTIGRLATELGMSKAGLFAHFGSKEALQLATVDAAQQIVIDQVIAPALGAATAALPRLRSLLANYESYARCKVLAGGCFFSAASAEFDDRPGRVRDRIVALTREWIERLEGLVRAAQAEGALDAALDACQLAFELNALAQGATRAYQLHQDPLAFERARCAIEHRLSAAERAIATPRARTRRT